MTKFYKIERNFAGIVQVYGEFASYGEALAVMAKMGGAPFYVKKYFK